jgi:Cellulase (glycosyl hydrolase family 5)
MINRLMRAVSVTAMAVFVVGNVSAAQAAAQQQTNALPVGRCINMGNHLEPPREGDWGRAIADDDFAIIRKAGFETVRIPVRWSGHMTTAAPYRIDPAFMARVKAVVAMARTAGLKVMINDHNFDALHADPVANRARLAEIWRQVAREFAGEPREHVWFEIANEPHDKLTNANLIETLSPALAAIRESNPDRPVIIGGEFWSGVDSLATLELPADPHIVPTFHYYDPFKFTHQGATWVNPVPPIGTSFGSPADRAELATAVAKVRAYVARAGKTPFMGEFGAHTTVPIDQRVLYQATVRTAFDQAGIANCAWAYTNTFPLYDSKQRKWIPGMRAAMGLAEPEGEKAEMNKTLALAATLAMAPVAATPAQAQVKQPTAELQALDDALPGTLINDPTGLDWVVFGPGATSKPIKGTTSPGGAALQITVPKKGVTIYEVGTNAPIKAAIKSGQRVTVAFYARTIKAETPDGNGVIGVRFQQNSEPYPGFGDKRVTVDSEWRLYEVTAVADRAISAGQAVVAFQLSGAKQTIEIGQTIVIEGAESVIAKGKTTRIPTPVMPPQLEGKGTLANDLAANDWQFFGPGLAHEIVAAKGMPGDNATRITVPNAGANAYDAGAAVPITSAITKGDIMIVAVLARTISADTPNGAGKIGVRVQQNAAPYPGFGDNVLSIGPTWKLLQIKTQAKINIPKGQAAIALQLAGAKQTVEIGRVYVLTGATP